MQDYREEFLTFAVETGVLRFGEFVLKSGRHSPYFFNSGLFNTGRGLARLGSFYARAIVDSGVRFDMVFGPAYKGIPLVAAVAIALAQEHGRDVPYCFNRKEVKDHGEGGVVVGAALSGRVLVVDDVISAGISVRESISIIRHAGAAPAGLVISLDRQERGTGPRSAVQELRDSGLQVVSIATLDDLVDFLAARSDGEEVLARVRRYREAWGESPDGA